MRDTGSSGAGEWGAGTRAACKQRPAARCVLFGARMQTQAPGPAERGAIRAAAGPSTPEAIVSDFTLAHDIIEAPGATPTRTAVLGHGILGNRQNWRSFARQLCTRRPDLRIITVDHRHHGDSSGAPDHDSVAACARDQLSLCAQLGLRADVFIGHSFGGKVALEVAAQRAAAGTITPPLTVFVLDAPPVAADVHGRDEHEVARVLQALRSLPQPLADRQDVVAMLVDRGFALPLARWMTTNLGRAADGWRWRFDLDGAARLIDDYFSRDYMDLLSTPRADLVVHVVRAALSDRWSPALIAALDGLPAGAPGRLHVLERAGHWVHADNPAGLLDLLDMEL